MKDWLTKTFSVSSLASNVLLLLVLGIIGKFVTTGVGHMRDRDQIKSKTKDNKMCFMSFMM